MKKTKKKGKKKKKKKKKASTLKCRESHNLKYSQCSHSPHQYDRMQSQQIQIKNDVDSTLKSSIIMTRPTPATSTALPRQKQPKTNQFKRNVNSRNTDINDDDDDDVADDDYDDDESANSLRARHHIKIYHDFNQDDDDDNDDNSNNAATNIVPAPIDSFDVMARRFDWPQWLVKNLAAFQFSRADAIQMQAIPIMMADQDLLCLLCHGQRQDARVHAADSRASSRAASCRCACHCAVSYS
jgi:hypothetical protein